MSIPTDFESYFLAATFRRINRRIITDNEAYPSYHDDSLEVPASKLSSSMIMGDLVRRRRSRLQNLVPPTPSNTPTFSPIPSAPFIKPEPLPCPAPLTYRPYFNALPRLITRPPPAPLRAPPREVKPELYLPVDPFHVGPVPTFGYPVPGSPFCSTPSCPVGGLHFKGMYIHGYQLNPRFDSEFGYSNPPPEIWAALDRQRSGDDRAEDRIALGAFCLYHYSGL